MGKIGGISWTTPARIVRVKVMSVTKEDYIIAAKSYGGGFLHITRKHIMSMIKNLNTKFQVI